MKLVNSLRFLFLFLFVGYCRNFVDSANEETQNKLGPLRVVTDDGMGARVNDESRFRLRDSYFQSVIDFDEQNKCTEINYLYENVWRYTALEDKHPNSLLYHKEMKLLTVMFDNSGKMYKCEDKKCTLAKEMNFGDFTTEKFVIVTEDQNGQEKENDSSSYVQDNFLGFRDFNLKSDYKCNEVKYDGKTIWKYDPSSQPNERPSKFFLILPMRTITVIFDNYYLSYKYEGNVLELLGKEQNSGFNLSGDVAFEYESSSSDEQNGSKFRSVNYPQTPVYAYFFNKDSNCSQIKVKDKILWKTPGSGLYAKSLTVNWYRKIATIETKNTYEVYTYVLGKWKEMFRFQYSREEDYKPADSGSEDKGSSPDEEESEPKDDQKGQSGSHKPRSHNYTKYVSYRKGLLIILAVVAVVSLVGIIALVIFLKNR